jgi:hypothetical protein
LGLPEAGKGSMTEEARKRWVGKPFGRTGMGDGYRCELCGEWIEYRDLTKLLAHEGPLPHVEKIRLQQVKNSD